eukprot:scaffold101256_cov72-Phaeocystis_antarctica.AAC.6
MLGPMRTTTALKRSSFLSGGGDGAAGRATPESAWRLVVRNSAVAKKSFCATWSAVAALSLFFQGL